MDLLALLLSCVAAVSLPIYSHALLGQTTSIGHFNNEISCPAVSLKASHDSNSNFKETKTQSLYLATCVPGLAPILAEELNSMHADITEVKQSGRAAVTFVATLEASLVALCWTRTAHRILEQVATSKYPILSREDLHAFVMEEVPVQELLFSGDGTLLTLSVKAILNNPRALPQDLSHSHFTALTIKNALCDVLRSSHGDRPDVDVDTPDVPVVAILHGDGGEASITLYRSLHPPGSLHRRGYRKGTTMHKAAMKESLAAGLLLEAGWHKKVREAKKNHNPLRLMDPMAGSGSLVLEAAMIAANIAPGLMRIRCGLQDHAMPPVTRWQSLDGSDTSAVEMWKAVLLDANQRARVGVQEFRFSPQLIRIYANDIHPGALEILEASLLSAGLSNLVHTQNMDCYDLELEEADQDIPFLVLTNPPWGLRLTADVIDSWEGLRHFVRDTCPTPTTVWVLSGDKTATKLLKLRRDRMIPIQTGDQNLRWIKYTISDKGSRRRLPQPIGNKDAW